VERSANRYASVAVAIITLVPRANKLGLSRCTVSWKSPSASQWGLPVTAICQNTADPPDPPGFSVSMFLLLEYTFRSLLPQRYGMCPGDLASLSSHENLAGTRTNHQSQPWAPDSARPAPSLRHRPLVEASAERGRRTSKFNTSLVTARSPYPAWPS